MADQRIDQLNAETTPAAVDLLPVFSIAGAETKKITVKNLVQVGATLIDNASIPVAKVNLSGISGANLSAGTVPITALDATNDILATGGLAVSSGNLELVAPTSPIVRNAGTGSLEHAVSGIAAAGTYTKVTVDLKGHVTAGTTLVGADVPVATSSVVGGVSIPAAGGLALTGGGALSHSNAVAGGASTRSGITFDLQGHVVSTVALIASDLPAATTAAKGAVIAGTGLAVDVNGILSTNAATTSNLGGIKIGSEFDLNGSNQLLLAVQASIAGGTAYPKVTVNSKGVVTAGAVLTAADIPSLDASKITTGSVDIARIAANTVTGAKLANYAISKIGDTTPTADCIGQFFFNPISRDLSMYDGNVYQPIGISVGEIIFAGTFDASTGSGTGLIASVTAEGTAIGLAIGQALPAAAAGNSRYYLVVSEAGTITTGNAPQVALTPPDIVLSNGTTWTEIDVSQTITAQVASNVSFTPAGNISATNVQTAIQELDGEKLPLAGGTITGNLEIGSAGSLSFEGATANTFETTLAVVDPTADRTITLPNVTGTVLTTGDTGTVTSTMLLDGTILNEDINASAAIAYSKLATLTSANILVGSSANVATSTAVTGDVTISNTGVTAIASDVIVNADVNASAAIAGTKIAPDFGAQNITTTGNVILNSQGDVRFADSDSSHYIALQAPATVTANVTLTLPAADGTNGQVLTTNGSGTLSFTTAAGGATDKIEEGNTSAEVIDTGSDGRFVVTTEGSERARIDSSGRLLVGTSSARGLSYYGTPQVQIEGLDYQKSFLSIYNNDADDNIGGLLALGRSRGTALGSNTAVQDGNNLGTVLFYGSDGSEEQRGADISAFVDGTPGAGDMPGRLVFSTTADGASSPTERMRIDNKGVTSTTCVSDNSGAFNIVHNGTNGQQYGLLIQTGNDQNNGTNYFLRCLGSGTDRLYIRSTGNVENTNNSYGGISDIKLKENIVNSGSQWNDLKALQVRKYNFKDAPSHTQIGLIAQEVELISPGLVNESSDRDKEGNDLGTVTKSVNYSVLYMKAVKALQEAMERIEQLETNNTDLLARVIALEAN